MQGSDGLSAWTVDVPKGHAKELMDEVLKRAEGSGTIVLVVDADLVFGRDHLRSALYHAQKAIDENRNSAESIVMETLLYLSGQRQLSAAISLMSVSDDTTRVAVAQISGQDLRPGDGWKPMAAYEQGASLERLKRFGITSEEIATIGAENPAELVLEKVAAVDLLKR